MVRRGEARRAQLSRPGDTDAAAFTPEVGVAGICAESALHNQPQSMPRERSVVRSGSPACEISLAASQCPCVSGVHCSVEIDASPPPDLSPGSSTTRAGCTLSGSSIIDTSTNGTWLVKGPGWDAATSTRPGAGGAVVARRLAKGARAEIRPGDVIFLLAPSHELSRQFRFIVEEERREDETVTGTAARADSCLVVRRLASGVKRSKSPAHRTHQSSVLDEVAGKDASDARGSGGVGGNSREVAESLESFTVEERKRRRTSSSGGGDSVDDGPSGSRELGGEEESGASSLPSALEEVSHERSPARAEHLTARLESDQSTRGAADTAVLPAVTLDAAAVLAENTSTMLETAEHDYLVTSNASPLSPAPILHDVSMEMCPHCLELFPVCSLFVHAEGCGQIDDSCLAPTTEVAGGDETDVDGPTALPSVPVSLTSARDCSAEECPLCHRLFPVYELVSHAGSCEGEKDGEVDSPRGSTPKRRRIDPTLTTLAKGFVPEGREERVYALESHSPTVVPSAVVGHESVSGRGKGLSDGRENLAVEGALCSDLEQCVHCLCDFPMPELLAHVNSCPVRGTTKKVCMYAYSAHNCPLGW